jgi:phage-related protein
LLDIYTYMVFPITYNGLAMNSKGVNERSLSVTHIAGSLCFLFFFVSLKSKIQKILRYS